MPVVPNPAYGNVTGAPPYLNTEGPSVQIGNIPVHPALMGQFRNWNEAYQAWRQSQLQGGNVPLSMFLANIITGGEGGAGPPDGGRISDQNLLATERRGSGTTSRTGTSTQNLPPEIARRYEAYIDRLMGKGGDYGEARDVARRSLMPLIESPGYNPEEIAQINISPEEEQAYITESGMPIAGAAEGARQNLLRYTSAAGYNPGLNATMERVAQDQERAAADAVIQSRLGILGQRRAGAQAIGEARSRGQIAGADLARGLAGLESGREITTQGQLGAALANYPGSERRTSDQIDTSERSGTGPIGTLSSIPVGPQQIGPFTRPPWMSDRDWRDYQTKNPQAGGSPPPSTSRSLMPRLP